IFIEEPIFAEGQVPRWELNSTEINVLVARPYTPEQTPGFSDEQIPYLKKLVAELVERENLPDHVVWFYTPMALPLAQELKPKAVIYDCMDELSAFLNAPPQLLEREAELLKLADVVFTGGPSLYRANKHRHHNVHCFPSSFDLKHSAPAAGVMDEPADQAGLPHPR